MDLTNEDARRVPSRLRIWAVSDGRAGIENQAVGVAAAVARLRTADIEVKRVRWRPWLQRLPTRLIAAPRLAQDASSDRLDPPWPDVFVGAGRAAIPFAIAMRRWSKRETLVVQVQDPRRAPGLFDIVAPPLHDGLQGANVTPILGAPHRLGSVSLANEAANFPVLQALPRPRVAFLVGGRSRAFSLPAPLAGRLAAQVARAARARGGSVMATVSRRTPTDAEAAVRAGLQGPDTWVWSGEGPNPYLAMVALADHFVVTRDSVNMVTEAAFTGRPVHVAAVEGRQARKDRFYAEMDRRGVTRPFDGRLEDWSYTPLNETARLAEEIVRRLDARGIDAGAAGGRMERSMPGPA